MSIPLLDLSAQYRPLRGPGQQIAGAPLLCHITAVDDDVPLRGACRADGAESDQRG